MMIDIHDFVNEEEYRRLYKTLKVNETRVIYNDNNIDIAIKKVGRKIFTFVNIYGDKKINEVLNNICSLV